MMNLRCPANTTHYYYYYAAFNAPRVGPKDDKSQAQTYTEKQTGHINGMYTTGKKIKISNKKAQLQ